MPLEPHNTALCFFSLYTLTEPPLPGLGSMVITALRAPRLRLDVLERRCPKGFGRFAKDVRAVGKALGLTTEPGGEAGRR